MSKGPKAAANEDMEVKSVSMPCLRCVMSACGVCGKDRQWKENEDASALTSWLPYSFA